jgi:hypothetical protein
VVPEKHYLSAQFLKWKQFNLHLLHYGRSGIHFEQVFAGAAEKIALLEVEGAESNWKISRNPIVII